MDHLDIFTISKERGRTKTAFKATLGEVYGDEVALTSSASPAKQATVTLKAVSVNMWLRRLRYP